MHLVRTASFYMSDTLKGIKKNQKTNKHTHTKPELYVFSFGFCIVAIATSF